ncbi:MAG: winged helix-turn-helix domain-containing protein [Halobacteriota archaeon]|nr:winged helix-turn-helix domain-containing protein [Halobacteriota archaeon]
MQSEFFDFSKFYGIYENASMWLRLIARSEIRIKILVSLSKGSKNLGELRELLNLSSSTILHAMRNMEVEGFIENSVEGYTLTNIGKIQAILINNLIKAIAVLEKDKDFWLTHDLSAIPDHLLRRIGELDDLVAVKGNAWDVLKPHYNLIQLLMKAGEVKSVSPVFHSDYPEIIETLVNNKADVELILTDKVMAKILESSRDILERMISEPNFRLWVIDEDVKVAITVTDSALSLGLFRDDETYDISTDLISHTDDALNWGRDLFEYYRLRSKKISGPNAPP